MSKDAKVTDFFSMKMPTLNAQQQQERRRRNATYGGGRRKKNFNENEDDEDGKEYKDGDEYWESVLSIKASSEEYIEDKDV